MGAAPAAKPTGCLSVCLPWPFQKASSFLTTPGSHRPPSWEPPLLPVLHVCVLYTSTCVPEGPGGLGRSTGQEAATQGPSPRVLGLGDHSPE